MKTYLIILVVALSFFGPLVSLWGQSIFEVDGITYRVIKDADESSTFGTVAVTAGNYMGAISIPNAVRMGGDQYADVYKVVEIDEGAFDNCAALEEVTIPVSIESIGKFAFRGCISLTSVIMPAKSNLTSLGISVFMASGLKSISLPDGLRSIPITAFYDCKELTEVVLPLSLTKIEMYAFSGCESLKKIALPERLNSIGACAFMRSGLEEIRLPMGIMVLDDHVFSNCSSLTKVELSPKTIKIGNCAFAYCQKLSEINKPETLKSISPSALERSEMIPDYYRP